MYDAWAGSPSPVERSNGKYDLSNKDIFKLDKKRLYFAEIEESEDNLASCSEDENDMIESEKSLQTKGVQNIYNLDNKSSNKSRMSRGFKGSKTSVLPVNFRNTRI